MAVPLDKCRLALKDIGEVWELQRELFEDQRLPLYFASDTVWEELGRLRGQVNDLCCRNVGEDREILQRLLRTIDDIYHLHVSGSKDRRERESAQDQGLKAGVAVDPTSSFRKLHGISNPFSFDSGATVAIGGLSTSTQTNESKDGFGQQSTDKGLDREEMTYRQLESPQGYEAFFNGPPSPRIMDRTSGISPVAPYFPYTADASQIPTSPWIVDQAIGTSLQYIPLGYPYIPHIGDTCQRRIYTSTARTSFGFSGTRPIFANRASTGALSTPRRDASTVRPNPAINLMYGSFDLSDEGQTPSSPIFEDE